MNVQPSQAYGPTVNLASTSAMSSATHTTSLMDRIIKRRASSQSAYCAIAVAAWTLAGGGSQALHAQPITPGGVTTASSEWGPGYGAAAVADGVAGENGNYWQTIERKDKGAWWQVDLGKVMPIHGLKIAWARYQRVLGNSVQGVYVEETGQKKWGMMFFADAPAFLG